MSFQKCLRPRFFWVIQLYLGSCVLAIANPAQAGGFDIDVNGNPPVIYTEVNVADQQNTENQKRSRFLDWQQWEQSYLDGENLCRERNGNIICLTTESANNLRW